MLCAVLLSRLSVGDSSPPKDTVVSGQYTQSPPWEGEAPAEPKEVVSGQPTAVVRAFLPLRTTLTRSGGYCRILPVATEPCQGVSWIRSA